MAIDFSKWLVDPLAVKCILVDSRARIDGVETVMKLSSKVYVEPDGDFNYLPVLDGGSVTLIERLTLDGSSSVSFGDIEVHNIGGELDEWLNYVWVNRRIEISVGDITWARTDFLTIFDGVIEDIGFKSSTSIAIKLRNKLERLNMAVSETELGGTTANQDELLPYVFGEVFNITPLFIDNATLKFKVNNGPIEDIIEVRDNGVPVSFTKQLSVGEFTLNRQPFGRVTCSVQGLKDGTTFLKTVPSIIKYLVLNLGDNDNQFEASEVDDAAFTASESETPQPVGIYLSQRENLLDVCEQLARSVGSQMVINREGKLQLIKVTLPLSGTPFDITTNDILEDTLTPTEKLEVIASYKIGYCKNWTIQENLETGIPQNHKSLYAKEWLNKISKDSTVKSQYRLTNVPQQNDTYLLKGTDALAEANRILNIYKSPRFIFEFEGGPRLIQLYIGDHVRITYPRFGLSSGKNGIVMGMSINWTDLTVKMEILV